MTEQVPELPSFRRVYVEDGGALDAAVESLSGLDVLGVDVEMGQRVVRKPGGLQEWTHVLALIQIAGGDLSVVIDPLRIRNLAPLGPLLSNSARKVFLGGGQDASLLDRAGIPARNVVDVGEVALALFGRREDGMAALARRIFGLSLDKTVRRTDWLARPLNPVLISYAHRDAELTLAIYGWFQERYPEALAFHERRELDPSLPVDAPAWLREVLTRSTQDSLAVVMEMGLDPARDGESLAADIRAQLPRAGSPRLANRLIRLAGDLSLTAVLPDILPLQSSPSALIRASVARAIGQLSEGEVGLDLLAALEEDPNAEVQRAVESARRDLRTPEPEGRQEPEDEEPGASLGADAMAALEQLRASMESSE